MTLGIGGWERVGSTHIHTWQLTGYVFLLSATEHISRSSLGLVVCSGKVVLEALKGASFPAVLGIWLVSSQVVTRFHKIMTNSHSGTWLAKIWLVFTHRQRCTCTRLVEFSKTWNNWCSDFLRLLYPSNIEHCLTAKRHTPYTVMPMQVFRLKHSKYRLYHIPFSTTKSTFTTCSNSLEGGF